jgi:hypothetical protein
MYFLLPLFGLAALAWLVNRSLQQRRRARLASEWNCQLPARRPARWPGGLDFVHGMLKADKAFDIPNHLTQVWRDMQVNTWVQNMAGTEVVVTCEPENVKALLATQFNDFELPEQRRQIFWGIFGGGIPCLPIRRTSANIR